MERGKTRPTCFDKALDLLARRGHFERELQAKLEGRGYEPDEVAETLERLAARGYLNDEKLARDFVAQRLARGPIGRRRLIAELRRRGVDESAAEAAVESIDEEAELEAARRAADRWSRVRGGSREALARHLERKGFPGRVILAILAETDGAAPEAESTPLNKGSAER